MKKFLLSLMLLASGWAWGADRLTHGGAAEAKAEVKMVKLTRDEDSFMVSLNKLVPFKMLYTGLGSATFQEAYTKKMTLMVSEWQFAFFKIYLENADVAIAALQDFNGDQIVDIMVMLNYLNTDLDHPEIQKLNGILVEQLLDKLSPDVLQKLFQKLWMEPGLNLSQTIPGTSASFSPDGSKLWVRFMDDGVSKIQLYQVATDRLVAIGAVVPGASASFSPDGSKLWVRFMDYGVSKIQLYQVATDRLMTIGVVVPGISASWSPDGSRLWVNFTDHRVDQIQLYQVAADKLVAVGVAVPGESASWSPDGSKLWVNFTDHGVDQIQLYQVANEGLVATDAVVPGLEAGFSPDGSKLRVARRNNGRDQVQVYQIIGNRLEALLSDPVPGISASWSPDGSKLWVSFTDYDIHKIQLYQVAADRLVAVGVAVPGISASWSPDGSKLWVARRNNGIDQIQLYQVTAGKLVAIGAVVPGLEEGWSPDGSKMWTQLKNGITYKIQLYQAIGNRLEALLSKPIPGHKAEWSPDGFRLLVFNDVTHQITVYFNIFLTYPDLSLAQQMLLIYVLNAHQMTNTAYTLPIELKTAWDFLPEPLRDHLVSNHIVNIATVSTDAKAA